MPNMSYCRFENTANNLQDCYDNMNDPDLSSREKQAQERLVELCRRIADDYNGE